MTDGMPRHKALAEPPLSNRGYDLFKQIVTVVYPGIITFYLATSEAWNLPYSAAIGATLTALGTLLGLILRVLSTKYAALQEAKKAEEASNTEYDGNVHFVKFEGQDAHLVLSVKSQEQVESFADREELTFKVCVGQS